MTTSYQGGRWHVESGAGVARRNMDESGDYPSDILDIVAYKDKNTIPSTRIVFLMI